MGHSLDLDKPVSRQMEEEIYTHYGWSPYWRISTSPLQSGAMAVAQWMADRQREGDEEQGQRAANPHLRSTREVIGYDVHAVDGDIGQVDDFIADDQMWQIRYLVVAMEDKKGILSPHWVDKVDWAQKHVAVSLENQSPATRLNLDDDCRQGLADYRSFLDALTSPM